MMQHVADWVAPLPRSQHFPPPPPLKFFHTPLLPPSSPSLPCVHDSWGGNHYHQRNTQINPFHAMLHYDRHVGYMMIAPNSFARKGGKKRGRGWGSMKEF